MKKAILMIFIAVLFMSTSPLLALDFMVGAKSGYFLWRPYYKEFTGSGVNQIETGSGVLYGPVLSVIITPRWSISAAGLFGTQTSFWSLEDGDMIYGPQSLTVTDSTWYADTSRIDLDFALSYRISKKFRAFAGYKYQYMDTGYEVTFVAEDKDTEAEFATNGEVIMRTPAHGPALGLGFSQVLGSNFFLTANLSAIYMFSKVEWKKNEWTNYYPDAADRFTVFPFSMDPTELKSCQIGLNFEPSFGVSVQKNLIIMLGARFQWMYIKFVDEPFLMGSRIAPDDWMNDFIYGGFVSVLYAF